MVRRGCSAGRQPCGADGTPVQHSTSTPRPSSRELRRAEVYWSDGARRPGGDRRGRGAPECEVEPASPQGPGRLQHWREDRHLLRVQAPRGAEHAEHYLRGCPAAAVNGILSSAAQVF